MKVLHVPFTYYPDACGGTEVYVAALCRFLKLAGVDSVVAAPGATNASDEHEGVCVRRFATHPALTQDMMYGEGDPVAAAGFAQILEAERPHIVHFHARSPAVGVLCLREARKRGIPAVYTYHTPTSSCLRGTLMRWGSTPCDGELRTHRCAACFLNAHGMPRLLAGAAVLASRVTEPLACLPKLPNAARAVLRSAALMSGFHDTTREWWAGMQRIIALCSWTRDLLLLNGVPEQRLSLVRHGLASLPESQATAIPAALPLKLAFLGRLDATKGIDLILKALQLLPDLPVRLDLYAITSGSDDAAARLLSLQVQSDPRITLLPPVPSSQVVGVLRNYHALLVPSRWLETGPLVVLEAFAAGIPVIGSNLGGIAEWVRDGHNGLLVPAPAPEAWRDVLRRLVDEPGLLGRLRDGVEPPRSMADVAADMSVIYRRELAVMGHAKLTKNRSSWS